jgi:2-polyprenyl-3-methyl-5-hydroxy-6-metoxy-1,4-benzoquinol methylase
MTGHSLDNVAKISRRVGYRSPGRYAFRAGFLFQGIPIQHRRVLDVGCGVGAFALWAALNGASFVLGIEPEAAGSTSGTLVRFRELISEFNLGAAVTASSSYLQQLEPEEQFDIVVMYNVINHLDEDAVVRLHDHERSREVYIGLIRSIFDRTTPNGVVIVADSSRHNACNYLGIPTPFTRGIEWQKHQAPDVWITLFQVAGYELIDLRWSPFYPLGAVRSRFVQFLTASHFVLRFRKPGNGMTRS